MSYYLKDERCVTDDWNLLAIPLIIMGLGSRLLSTVSHHQKLAI